MNAAFETDSHSTVSIGQYIAFCRTFGVQKMGFSLQVFGVWNSTRYTWSSRKMSGGLEDLSSILFPKIYKKSLHFSC